jgi:hypothetical protein
VLEVECIKEHWIDNEINSYQLSGMPLNPQLKVEGSFIYSEGGKKFLQQIGAYSSNYMVSYTRGQ